MKSLRPTWYTDREQLKVQVVKSTGVLVQSPTEKCSVPLILSPLLYSLLEIRGIHF